MANKTEKMTKVTKPKNKEVSSAEVKTNGPETRNGIINGALHVRIRREPQMNDDNTIGILQRGDKVTILEKIGKFYKISVNESLVGYILSDFIKEE